MVGGLWKTGRLNYTIPLPRRHLRDDFGENIKEKGPTT